METLLQDVRYALRQLRQHPGFTLVSVLTLALGIGATTAVFSVVNALLLRPLPVATPERLVSLHEVQRGAAVQAFGQSLASHGRFREFQQATREVFAGLAAFRLDEGSLRTEEAARPVMALTTSANYFDVLGVRPALGGFFHADQEPTGGAEPTVVLSHRLWTSQFGARPGVIGEAVAVNGRAYTIVGVAPAEFHGTLSGLLVDLWLPAGADPAVLDGTRGLLLFGRLRDGLERARAEAALQIIAPRLPPDRPELETLGVRLDALTGVPAAWRDGLIGFVGLLFGTAALVLAIAGTNVAGVLLARAAGRRRELALRLALGAGRGRVVRQLLTESLLLFLLGAGAGLLLTMLLTRLLRRIDQVASLPVSVSAPLDMRVLAFALAVALACGVGFSLAPALRATRAAVLPALKAGERGATPRSRLQSAFVVAQLALSVLLLVCAGLFVRTLQQALRADVGFDAAAVVSAEIDLVPIGYEPERAARLFAQLTERVRAQPGVEQAGLAVWAPLRGNSWTQGVQRADGAGADEHPLQPAEFRTIGPNYFRTLRIPLLAGRDFANADREGAPPVVIVNRALAERIWPGENPVGRRLRVNGRDSEVVGVARDGKYVSLREEPTGVVFRPLAQNPRGAMTLLVRSHATPAAVQAMLRRELAALEPAVALSQVQTLPGVLRTAFLPQRIAALLIGVFGLVGLLLAALGVYGALALQVAQRTREIGVRVALGARVADVVRLVLRRGATLALLGLAVGTLAAAGATRVVASLLYGVSPTDPLTFAAVALLLLAVALLASWLPARRAARVDPVIALRAD